TSNPTWTKLPHNPQSRLTVEPNALNSVFKGEIDAMISAMDEELFDGSRAKDQDRLEQASSDALPVDDCSVDLILSSPPYCTRIDYAVATMPELGLLGYGSDQGFAELRRRLIGTSTVPKLAPPATPEWGPTCNGFLERVESHPSKASKTYYLKSHLQYFHS